MTELKKCPFCGSEAAYYEYVQADHDRDSYWTVECVNADCKIEMFGEDGKKESCAELWNKRAEKNDGIT